MLFNIFGEKFEVDVLDYDQMVKVEQECEAVVEKVAAIRDRTVAEGMRQSELVKESTEVIAYFFDEVLGAGAAERIFKGKINYGHALKAFGEFIAQKNQHSGDDIRAINDEYMKRIKPATPTAPAAATTTGVVAMPAGGNRQQRRQASKKNKRNNYPNKHGK